MGSLVVEAAGGVMTIHRPEVLNAMALGLLADLSAALRSHGIGYRGGPHPLLSRLHACGCLESRGRGLRATQRRPRDSL